MCNGGVGGGTIGQEQVALQLETLLNENKWHSNEKGSEAKKCLKRIELTQKLTKDEGAFLWQKSDGYTTSLLVYKILTASTYLSYFEMSSLYGCIVNCCTIWSQIRCRICSGNDQSIEIIPRNGLDRQTIFAHSVKQSRHMCLCYLFDIVVVTPTFLQQNENPKYRIKSVICFKSLTQSLIGKIIQIYYSTLYLA